jgi:probable rRNA maturation factor
MAILIENMQETMEIKDEIYDLLTNAVEKSLALEKFKIPCEVSILLVDDETIRGINKEHRDIDKPTDVLSFPIVDMIEGKFSSNEGDMDLDENQLLLGDIVISVETARRQSEEYLHSFEREMAFLATHGVFHLLGYDHMEEPQEKKMMDKQEAVLDLMNLSR